MTSGIDSPKTIRISTTEANHVVPFDRWGNPAVENQATDRGWITELENDQLIELFSLGLT